MPQVCTMCVFVAKIYLKALLKQMTLAVFAIGQKVIFDVSRGHIAVQFHVHVFFSLSLYLPLSICNVHGNFEQHSRDTKHYLPTMTICEKTSFFQTCVQFQRWPAIQFKCKKKTYIDNRKVIKEFFFLLFNYNIKIPKSMAKKNKLTNERFFFWWW